MTTSFSTRVDSLPLDLIKEDEFLTPELLRVKKHWDIDKSKVDRYLALVGDLNFNECLKVWQWSGQYYLLDNYELLRALKIYHKDHAKILVHCLIVAGGSQKEIKQLSTRLRYINPTGRNHLSRLLDVYTLAAIGLNLREIKCSFGITSRAEEKMVERDFKIAKSPILSSMVLGIKLGVSTSDIMKLLSPEPGKAKLPYGLALEILGILYGDENNISQFAARYEKYLSGLREKNVYEDEAVKPIHQWQKFSKHKVKAIAASVARNGGPLAFDSGYLIGDSALENHKFGITYNDVQFKLTIPQTTIDLADKSAANLKRLVDFFYKMEKLNHSLQSYIRQVRPVDHGEKVRPQDISPSPESRSNMPRFEDFGYIKYLTKNKLLAYANTELLLKSLALHAHNFGFPSYEYNAKATYKTAHESFEKWFHDELADDVRTFFSGSSKRHPKYDIYDYIRSFLKERVESFKSAKSPTIQGDPTDAVFFGVFIQELFKHVFRWMDTHQAIEREKVQTIAKETLDLRYSDLKKLFGKIRRNIRQRRADGDDFVLDDKLLEEIFIAEGTTALFKELRLPDENRWTATTHQISHLIHQLAGSMDAKFNLQSSSDSKKSEVIGATEKEV